MLSRRRLRGRAIDIGDRRCHFMFLSIFRCRAYRSHYRSTAIIVAPHPDSQLQAAGKMLTQVPEEPWATVCADFVGPFPRSKHGNSMLLDLVDRFSEWTEIVPIRKATTETLRKAVRERIVARYEVPKVIITDNEVQFTSRAFKRFLEQKWSEVQLSVNTSVAETTGYSPAFITQGREPRLPNALFDEQTAGTGRCTQTPAENAEKIKEFFELVRRNMEKAAQD
ncbi:uncharacterized protein LOC122756589 [Drosophila santomea]|uniref:uncharacterized protein LOC122756445 n=1 Tax=Drosophila santomea TaxID=129105 RepID=UPI001CCF39A7|nr:uncharacterized protein LOC122756445 [Drosophila santomea]XP_043862617.1 uncharacterized protein LOC122756589 [Drosophila santomea]